MRMPTRSPGNTPSEARACAAATASVWSWRNVRDSLPLQTATLSGTIDSVCSNCAGIVVNCLAASISTAWSVDKCKAQNVLNSCGLAGACCAVQINYRPQNLQKG